MTEWESQQPLDEWDDLAGGDDGTTVRDRIVDQLDAEAIHGVALTAKHGQTAYLVVAASTNEGAKDVLDLRTVIVDLADEVVKVSDNGLWVPRSQQVAGGLTSLLGRATNDLAAGDVDAGPLAVNTGVEEDVDELLASEIRDDYQREDSDDYTTEPPEEIGVLIDRLDEAGIGTAERFNRLRFGKKSPFDHDLGAREDLYGNYGMYATAGDPLVLVDVDYPDEAPDLPETFAVSSPHGDERRAHHYFRVETDDVEPLKERAGKFNFGPSWGEVRTQNQYVVGPGSQLDPEGCDTGEYEEGDPAACEACSDKDGGYYRIVNDAPIATIPVDDLLDLLDEDPAVTLDPETGDDETAETVEREPPADGAESDDSDEQDDETEETVTCENCDDEVPRSEATVWASSDERTVWKCRGGCS